MTQLGRIRLSRIRSDSSQVQLGLGTSRVGLGRVRLRPGPSRLVGFWPDSSRVGSGPPRVGSGQVGSNLGRGQLGPPWIWPSLTQFGFNSGWV